MGFRGGRGSNSSTPAGIGLRQCPYYRLYNYGYYGDNNNIHYNNNDEHTDKINLLKGSDRQCMVVKLRM